MAVPPTVDDLAGYLQMAAPTEDLADALEAALEAQAARCVTEPYTRGLYRAAMRRAARELAARGAPLGALDLGPMGSSPIARWDAVIEDLEAPYRRSPIGGTR